MPPLILIIDDSRIVRNALSDHCVGFGYRTITAESGEEGLRLLHENKVDLIITDVLMPGMNGDEVIRLVKQIPSLAAIPILVVSGNADEAMTITCIELGAEDVLPKPFEPALLHARICAGLERSKLRLLEIHMREEKAAEKFGQELVGAICHNFNQPLTAASGDIHFASSLIAHLEKYIRYIYDHLSPASRAEWDACVRDFAEFSGKRMLHEEIFQSLHDVAGSVTASLKRITDLVQDVRSLNRPAAQRYIDTSRITNFEESKKPVILLAMRNDEIRKSCEERLNGGGYRILSADQETKTTEHAWFSSPHLIVADANQPDMEDILGILRLKSIRELEIPVIILADSATLVHDALLNSFSNEIDAILNRSRPDLLDALLRQCDLLLMKQPEKLFADTMS